MQNQTSRFLVAESKAERALEHITILKTRLKMMKSRAEKVDVTPENVYRNPVFTQVRALEEMLRSYNEYYQVKKTEAAQLLNELHGEES